MYLHTLLNGMLDDRISDTARPGVAREVAAAESTARSRCV
jgi:hypothetical protein